MAWWEPLLNFGCMEEQDGIPSTPICTHFTIFGGNKSIWTSSCQWLRFSFKMSILTLYNLLWGNLGKRGNVHQPTSNDSYWLITSKHSEMCAYRSTWDPIPFLHASKVKKGLSSCQNFSNLKIKIKFKARQNLSYTVLIPNQIYFHGIIF